MKTVRTLFLLFALSLLGACSNTFLYNQLDWLATWYVDDYVDLSREQRRDLKQQVRELLAWHRKEELASYIEILDQIEADLDQPVSSEQVEAWANETYLAYMRLEERMLPVAFDMGNQLTDAQMEEFMESLRRGQEELEEEYLTRSDEEYVEDAREGLGDALEDFLGRLTPEQKMTLDTAAASLQRFDGAWLDERALWLDTLAVLLQREPGWEDGVRKALDEREANRTETYRTAYAHNAVIINGAIAEVLNLRTGKQDRRLRREIDGYRKDIRKLIAQVD